MIWSTEKCTVPELPDYPNVPPYMLAGNNPEGNTMTKCLGITDTYDGIAEHGSEARMQKVLSKLCVMTAARMHDSHVTSEKLLPLCKIMVLAAAKHEIHLKNQSDILQKR